MAVALFCLQRRRKHMVPRIFRDRQNPLEFLTDNQIIQRYRLDRESIFEICALLNSDLVRSTNRSHSLPVSLQVLTALRFYATGAFQSIIGDGFNIGKMSVSRCVRDVSYYLSCLVGNYVSFPENRMEQVNIKQKFYELGNFPNVLGAIDGTFIPILAPNTDEHVYVCRKGFHAINVQGIVDANMKFLNIVARWPGSTHDSFIWTNCEVLKKFETREIGEGWLLGDSAYPCQPWLMTPTLQANTCSEIKYNRAHKSTRCVVERGFGMWKMRFRCLHKSGGCLMFSPDRCIRVIMSTAIIHNICISKRIPLLDMEIPDFHDIDLFEDNYDGTITNGMAVREQLINTVFND